MRTNEVHFPVIASFASRRLPAFIPALPDVDSGGSHSSSGSYERGKPAKWSRPRHTGKSAILLRLLCATIALLVTNAQARAGGEELNLESVLARAQTNRPQIELALAEIAVDQREGLQFLITNMPDEDLRSLSAEFLLEHVQYAYRAFRETPWNDQVPTETFLNNVLPYASIDERRDAWRKDFYERFQPLVKDATTAAQAAAILNQKIFSLVDVKYSRARPKPNQSSYESIEAHAASCSGLSVLLIDACRAVGVPARFVGTPLWSDRSGNHAWVEIWSDGWHFTGAAEPSGDELDKAWFVDRASKAQRDEPMHAIYATSFKKTSVTFPLVWDRRNTSVCAVNVTDRYTRPTQPVTAGSVAVRFRVLDRPGGDRVAAQIQVAGTDNKLLFTGTTKDERFDGNDHLTATLPTGTSCQIMMTCHDAKQAKSVEVTGNDQLVTFYLDEKSIRSP